MNFIKHLQFTVKEQVARYLGITDAITDFQVHLNGPKFRDDSTIQIADVLTRLDSIVDTGQRHFNEQYDANRKEN